MYLTLVVLLLLIGVGYAVLTTNLTYVAGIRPVITVKTTDIAY